MTGPRLAVPVILLLAGLVVVGACTSEGPAPEAAGSPSTTAAASGKPSGSSERTPLRVQGDDGGGVSCIESGGKATDLGLWDETLIASTPLRLTGADAVGSPGVRVAGGLVAPVVGGRTYSSGLSDWPLDPPDRLLGSSLDWKARTPLVGTRLSVQRAVLPFVHVRARPGAVLRTLRISYLTDDGRTGSVTVEKSIRFSRGRC